MCNLLVLGQGIHSPLVGHFKSARFVRASEMNPPTPPGFFSLPNKTRSVARWYDSSSSNDILAP